MTRISSCILDMDVVFGTQSITSEKISGDKIHPCLTPVFTVKHADKSMLLITLQLLHIFIEALNDIYDLLGNTLRFSKSLF